MPGGPSLIPAHRGPEGRSAAVLHCCSRFSEPPWQLLSPPSTSSRASTPPEALLLLVRATGLTPSLSFRPRGFAPPRRFAPPWSLRARLRVELRSFPRVAGLLHPAANPGVRAVSPRHRATIAGRRGVWIPGRAVHTPRRSPLAHSRVASLRPLPPRRFYDLEALLRVPVRHFPRC
jgi:hypothetical protein